MSDRPERGENRQMAESQLSELQNARVLLEEARGLSRNPAYHRRAASLIPTHLREAQPPPRLFMERLTEAVCYAA